MILSNSYVIGSSCSDSWLPVQDAKMVGSGKPQFEVTTDVIYSPSSRKTVADLPKTLFIT